MILWDGYPTLDKMGTEPGSEPRGNALARAFSLLTGILAAALIGAILLKPSRSTSNVISPYASDPNPCADRLAERNQKAG